MKNDNNRTSAPMKPQQQTGEKFGSIKGQQRGEDDFKGKSDMPRGSEVEQASAARRRS